MAREKHVKPIALIIDADVLVHKFSRAAEHRTQWFDGLWTWYATESDTDAIHDAYMENLTKALDVDLVVMAVSDLHSNFRNSVYPEYKCDRSDDYGPMMKPYLRNRFLTEYQSCHIHGLEADDCIGIMMTNPDYLPEYRKIQATIDKDLKTIPGEYYNLDKDTLETITLEEADAFFYQQCLTGDRTDGIPGCPGIGDITAQKILTGAEDFPEIWRRIVATYAKKGFDEEYVITMAQLVRILRLEDFDLETKTPKLWRPKL